jgi:hypothetical protein
MANDSDVARLFVTLRTPAIKYHSFGNAPVRSSATPAEAVRPEPAPDLLLSSAGEGEPTWHDAAPMPEAVPILFAAAEWSGQDTPPPGPMLPELRPSAKFAAAPAEFSLLRGIDLPRVPPPAPAPAPVPRPVASAGRGAWTLIEALSVESLSSPPPATPAPAQPDPTAPWLLSGLLHPSTEGGTPSAAILDPPRRGPVTYLKG